MQQPAPRAVEQRIVRLVWLTARLVRRESVSYDDCQRRFDISLRTFYRDIAALRTPACASAPNRTNRMTCFVSDTDGA